MTLPDFLLGMLLSTLLGAIFHLWRGGGLNRLVFYIIISWIGFWGGHILCNKLGWTLLSVGTLRVGMGIFGNLVLLALAYFLPNPQPSGGKK